MADPITIDDFKKIELKTGKILEAGDHPNADRLLVLKVDIGGGETRQVVAGIKSCYKAEDLVGKSVVLLVNLQPATLRGVESQGMMMAATHEDKVVVLTLDQDLPPGSTVR